MSAKYDKARGAMKSKKIGESAKVIDRESQASASRELERNVPINERQQVQRPPRTPHDDADAGHIVPNISSLVMFDCRFKASHHHANFSRPRRS